MKKLIFILFAIFVSLAFGKDEFKPETVGARFLGYLPNEDYFLFKRAKTRFACKIPEITMISQKRLERCVKDKKNLNKIGTSQKKMVEKIVPINQTYYVKVVGQTNQALICDIYNIKKKSMKLELVRAGLAMPTSDEKESLIEANVLAMEGAKGFFDKKYAKITKCAFNIKDENSANDQPKKVEETKPIKEAPKDRPSIEISTSDDSPSDEPMVEKPSIEISTNE